MVKFVAKTLAVDTSNLAELDGYQPFGATGGASLEIKSHFSDRMLTVKVTVDDTFKYKIAKIETSKNKADKLFKGDWEPKVFNKADKIQGSTKDDALYGFDGNDTIKANSGNDTIYGGKNNDTLYGEDGGDTMFGDAGKDFLDGGAGVNTLTGGSAKDTFSFSATLVGGNYAEITDFEPGTDKIQLAKSAFEGIGAKGTLKAGQFFLASEYDGTAKAIVYDATTGNLSYSKNGGGVGQVFGRIGNGADLDNKDFIIA